MTQQEMEARIEKLEKQVIFMSALCSTTHLTTTQLAGEEPTKADLKLVGVLLQKANDLDTSIEELFK